MFRKLKKKKRRKEEKKKNIKRNHLMISAIIAAENVIKFQKETKENDNAKKAIGEEDEKVHCNLIDEKVVQEKRKCVLSKI